MSFFISFASIDGVHVNQHFGWCEKFYMYEMSEEGYSFSKELDAALHVENESDKLNYKIECLGVTHLVCVSQIGPKAASMVQASGIFPMKSSHEKERIDAVLEKIFQMLHEDTPLWLKRIVMRTRE